MDVYARGAVMVRRAAGIELSDKNYSSAFHPDLYLLLAFKA